MEKDIMKKRRNDSAWNGFVFIAAGGLLLAYKMGAPIPTWVFTWQMLLIAIGIITGLKSNFQNRGWIILILVGGLFLADDIFTNIDLHDYILPIILITVGLVVITKPKRSVSYDFFDKDKFNYKDKASYTGGVATDNSYINETGEFININAVFGGVKKMVLSKNFTGGEINCFMGGAEVNLSQSDIKQPVKMEINNVFGGTKIIVPSDWDVKSEATTVFGGVEDKRSITSVTPTAGKTLIIEGNCFFGGIEIKNF